MNLKYLSQFVIAGMIVSIIACQPKNDDDDVKTANHGDKGKTATTTTILNREVEEKIFAEKRFDIKTVTTEDFTLFQKHKDVLQSSSLDQWVKVDDLKLKYFITDKILISVSKPEFQVKNVHYT